LKPDGAAVHLVPAVKKKRHIPDPPACEGVGATHQVEEGLRLPAHHALPCLGPGGRFVGNTAVALSF